MPDQPRKPDPMRRILAFGCLAPFILFLAVAVGALVWSQVQLDALRDDVNADDEPLTIQALNDWYGTPSPGENGATLYLQGYDAVMHTPVGVNLDLVPIVGTSETDWPHGEAWPEDMTQEVAVYLAAQPVPLQKIQNATGYTAFRFPVDFANVGGSLTHLADMRHLGRIAGLSASYAARSGDTDRAVEMLHAHAHLVYALGHEPLLISQLVTCALTGQFVHSVEDVLSTTQLSHEHLDAVLATADTLPGLDSMKTAFIGERAYYLSQPPMGLPVIRSFDRMVYTRRVTEHIRLANEPPRVVAERVASIGVVSFSPVLNRLLLTTTAMVMPAISRSTDAFVRAHVQQESVRVAVAIEKYRLDNQQLPNDLDQLVPAYLDAIPDDPYSNDSLRYLQLNPGYVLYSVGPNRTDDQGAPIGGNQTGDIPFRVNR